MIQTPARGFFVKYGMRSISLDDIQPYITPNDSLNDLLFEGYRMHTEVQDYLLDCCLRLVNCFENYTIDLRDIVLVGSNAGFYYNDHSDVDIHLVGNYHNLTADIVNRHLAVFHNKYGPFKLTNTPIDFYMEHYARPPTVIDGAYSLMQKRWIIWPSKKQVSLDPETLSNIYYTMLEIIDWAMYSEKLDQIKHDIVRLKKHRDRGLCSIGDLSSENLAFKVLRKQGHVKALYDHHDRIKSINTI